MDPAVPTLWLACRRLRDDAKGGLNADRHAEISRPLGAPSTGSSQQAWGIKKAPQGTGSNRRKQPKTQRYLDADGRPATTAQHNSNMTTAHYKRTMTRPDMAEPNVIDRIEMDPDQATGIPDENGQPIQSFASRILEERKGRREGQAGCGDVERDDHGPERPAHRARSMSVMVEQRRAEVPIILAARKASNLSR